MKKISKGFGCSAVIAWLAVVLFLRSDWGTIQSRILDPLDRAEMMTDSVQIRRELIDVEDFTSRLISQNKALQTLDDVIQFDHELEWLIEQMKNTTGDSDSVFKENRDNLRNLPRPVADLFLVTLFNNRLFLAAFFLTCFWVLLRNRKVRA